MRSVIFLFILLISSTLLSTDSYAEEPTLFQTGVPSAINIFWISPTGEQIQLPWAMKHEWIWDRDIKSAALRRPYSRTWLQLPKDFKVVQFKAKGSRFLRDAKNHPFPEEAGPVFTIDIATSQTKGYLIYEQPDGQKKKIGFAAVFSETPPAVLNHPSCLKEGIVISTKQIIAQHQYVGLFCQNDGTSTIKTYFFYSPDASFKHVNLAKSVIQQTNKGPFWKGFRVFKDIAKTKIGKPFALITIAKRSSPETSIYYLKTIQTEEQQKPFQFSANLSPTYIIYKESLVGVNLSEIALTGRISGSYQLSEDWDTSLSVFFTLLPITHSPATVVSTRFYGVNTRAGYALLKNSNTTFKLNLGWYFWGMMVSDKSYGVSSLVGPQILLTSLTHTESKGAFGLYLKFAPILSSFSEFSLQNREVAFGGSYLLTRIAETHPLWLSLNIADIRYSSSVTTKTMSTTSISLGLEYGF